MTRDEVQQICNTCRYWRIEGSELASEPSQFGGCYRYAPRPGQLSVKAKDPISWPVTYSDDWCGEWEEKE